MVDFINEIANEYASRITAGFNNKRIPSVAPAKKAVNPQPIPAGPSHMQHYQQSQQQVNQQRQTSQQKPAPRPQPKTQPASQWAEQNNAVKDDNSIQQSVEKNRRKLNSLIPLRK